MVLPQGEAEIEQPVVGGKELVARALAGPGGDDLPVLHRRERREPQLGHLLHQVTDLSEPVVVQPVPVAEVEPGPVHEQGDASLDLLGRGRDGAEVHVAVEDAVVDAVGRRDHVVPGVVLRERRERELEEGGVPRGQGLGPVDAVVEPEAAVFVVPAFLGEQGRVGVEPLPPLGPRRGLDLEGAGESVGHGRPPARSVTRDGCAEPPVFHTDAVLPGPGQTGWAGRFPLRA